MATPWTTTGGLLLISDCEGSGCSQKVDAALAAASVHVVSDCDTLSGLSYADARTWRDIRADLSWPIYARSEPALYGLIWIHGAKLGSYLSRRCGR